MIIKSPLPGESLELLKTVSTKLNFMLDKNNFFQNFNILSKFRQTLRDFGINRQVHCLNKTLHVNLLKVLQKGDKMLFID